MSDFGVACANLSSNTATAHDYYLNKEAAVVATASLVVTILVYGWNIWCLRTFTFPGPDQKNNLPINAMSGVLASVIRFVLIFATTWPQPIEGAAMLLIVLAHASVLGWQDHDPEDIKKDLIEKLPDVIAVVIATFALQDTVKRNVEDRTQDWWPQHDPKIQEITSYAFVALGCALGIGQLVWHRTAAIMITRKRYVCSTHSHFYSRPCLQN